MASSACREEPAKVKKRSRTDVLVDQSKRSMKQSTPAVASSAETPQKKKKKNKNKVKASVEAEELEASTEVVAANAGAEPAGMTAPSEPEASVTVPLKGMKPAKAKKKKRARDGHVEEAGGVHTVEKKKAKKNAKANVAEVDADELPKKAKHSLTASVVETPSGTSEAAGAPRKKKRKKDRMKAAEHMNASEDKAGTTAGDHSAKNAKEQSGRVPGPDHLENEAPQSVKASKKVKAAAAALQDETAHVLVVRADKKSSKKRKKDKVKTIIAETAHDDEISRCCAKKAEKDKAKPAGRTSCEGEETAAPSPKASKVPSRKPKRDKTTSVERPSVSAHEPGHHKATVAPVPICEQAKSGKTKKIKAVMVDHDEGAGHVHTVSQSKEKSAQDVLNETRRHGVRTWQEDGLRRDVKEGPYSAEEDKMLLDALKAHATALNLSTGDFSWALEKGTVKVNELVSNALPARTFASAWSHLRRLISTGTKKGAFSSDEDATLMELQELHGNKWKFIGAQMGRGSESCRDRWRRIRITGTLHGRWSAEEDQRLEDIVDDYQAGKAGAEDLVARATAEDTAIVNSRSASSKERHVQWGNRLAAEKPNRRVVRDDINWLLIADKMKTRNAEQCASKWYEQLRPNMTETGEWGGRDDVLFLKTLWMAKPRMQYEVAWDAVVPGRDMATTKRRWHLMRMDMPGWRDHEMPQQIKYLTAKHTPKLLKDRTAPGLYMVSERVHQAACQAQKTKDSWLIHEIAMSAALGTPMHPEVLTALGHGSADTTKAT